MISVRLIALTVVAGTALACASQDRRPVTVQAAAPDGVMLEVRSFELPGGVPDGLSGLSLGPDGGLLAVAEEDRVLVALEGSGERHLILGISRELETESISVLGDGRLAIGTESYERERQGDQILIASPVGVNYRVTDSVRFSYEAWRHVGAPNEGVEGLCVVNHVLFAVSEVVLDHGGGRISPMAMYDFVSGAWHFASVSLTSASGKLSALSCREGPDGSVEFAAVERHLDVRRILRWAWIPSEPSEFIVPSVFLDFTALSDENPEGLAWAADGALYVVTDNQHRNRTVGPGSLLRIRSIAL